MDTANEVGRKLICRVPEVVVCLVIFSTLMLAQAGGTTSKRMPMGEALSDVQNHINRAASAAGALQKAAPLLERAQSEISRGERREAMASYQEARLLLESTPPSAMTAPLLRSVSTDLDRIISSLSPGRPAAGGLMSDSILQDDSQRAIRQYLAYYQGKGRSTLELGWKRMGAYQPALESILRERNLPSELVYLGITESGFNRWALSPRQARGIWQFIPTTAARYGLVQTPGTDERIDPIKSTMAAAEYLKDLYGSFGDWYLALAAYNAGENRIRSAMARTGIRDFWTLRRLGLLPRETANYVPAVLATISISRNPREFGFLNPSPRGAPDSKLKAHGENRGYKE